MDVAMNYYTLQLGRCAVFSMILIPAIMALRGMCKKRVFLKGLLWSLLVIAPFIGRLRSFYEDGLVFRVSWWWISICMSRLWISRLYFAGMAVTAGVLWRRRRRLMRFVKGLREERLSDIGVFVCSPMVTPFTAGVFRPKIVLPEIMLKQYAERDLDLILLHEKMHIRLGHLLFYLLWDVLHVLLWVNPLFAVCLKYFKADMEDICDSVTMRRSESTGYEYGSLLLRSMKLLQGGTGMPEVRPPFAFAGEEEFSRIRRRVKTVACHKDYRRSAVLLLAGSAVLMLGVTLADIRERSYPRYQEMDEITVFDMSGKKTLVQDCRELRDAVCYDADYLYVDSRSLLSILRKQDVTEEEFVILYGGFYKLPGYGGGGGCEILDRDLLGRGDLRLPANMADDPLLLIYKHL